MDTKPKLTREQAELLASEILKREPRVSHSWIDTLLRMIASGRNAQHRLEHEFSPLAHPSNPRWPIYNSIFDNWHK